MSRTLKVLIVDDDPIMQHIIQKNLDSIPILHHTVNGGFQAIEELKSKQYDFVLMDIRMPQQDGIDAIRWLRDSEDDYNKKLPVFALTAFSSSAHTKEILEAGMNGHLIKPLDLDRLNELLRANGLM
jgi:CheY-like chemotaxis protein